MAKAKTTGSANKKQLFDLAEVQSAGLVLRSLNHKIRQNILNLLDANKEVRVTDVYKKLKLEQSLASSYLGMLRRANVVKTRRDGQVIYYSVNYQRLSEIGRAAKMINGK